MKTITMVLELSDEESDAFEHIKQLLNDAHLAAEVNEYAGDVRPVANPRIALYIEGGNLQHVMANLPIAMDVVDADNLESEGQGRDEIETTWNQLIQGLPVEILRTSSHERQ